MFGCNVKGPPQVIYVVGYAYCFKKVNDSVRMYDGVHYGGIVSVV